MGTDIHQYTYLYDKKGKRYVCAHDILGYDAKNYFPELVPNRSYIIFGMLCGVRDNRHQIVSKYGFPDCIDPILKNDLNRKYHSPQWFLANDLCEQLKNKKKQILKNKEVYDDFILKYEGDELYDKLEEYAEQQDSYDYVWIDDDVYYIKHIDTMVDILEKYYSIEDEELNAIFDRDKTIIFFCFDS
jgi:hypothetical protein